MNWDGVGNFLRVGGAVVEVWGGGVGLSYLEYGVLGVPSSGMYLAPVGPPGCRCRPPPPSNLPINGK